MDKNIKFIIRTLLLSLALFWLPQTSLYGMDAMAYFKLGSEGGMTYKKIEYYTKALDLNPGFAVAYAKRGMLYYFQEKYDKVIQDFYRYSQLEPNEAEAFRMLGMAYLKKDTYENAIENFNQAIKMNPNLTGAYAYQAEAYRLAGRYDEAISDSTKAIKLWGDPRMIADAYNTRAKTFLELGEDRRAQADFKKSIELDPRKVFLRYLSGYASLEAMRIMGLVILIGIAFIFIFGLKFRPPDKEE
jgi:tetratricopeptide (TPR) repeat protein